MYEFGVGAKVRLYNGVGHGTTGVVTRYNGMGTKVWVKFDGTDKEVWVWPHRLIPAEGTEHIKPGPVRNWRNKMPEVFA